MEKNRTAMFKFRVIIYSLIGILLALGLKASQVFLIVFVPLSIVSAAYALACLLPVLMKSKWWARSATRLNVQRSQKISSSLWRVDVNPVVAAQKNRIVVYFTHLSWGNRYLVLGVRNGHPDILRFCGLKEGDIVEFESRDEALASLLPQELCAYLRIKSVRKDQ